ncbi:ankyrin repeat and zinc finger domain-containing protein 1-like [Venturia canescens]|uniref:ankyrin repeat and zinc finger domain-containing protein 1-like n=1 Tax=Venturia canescens TaxID=32260 RepID=UPI001C9C463B|nr:ankyrin repeat and zinc finger domain-containing protein 1-like [Venturia canescens]
MDHQMFKIYNQRDFDRITKGIKVAQCMQSKSSSVPDAEAVLSQLEDLVVSDSLCCSFCNIIFENKSQQRLHYKLDWHRYNLKRRLLGLKSVTEDGFSLLAEDDDVSSLSGSEMESENEEETATSENGSSPSGTTKGTDSDVKTGTPSGKTKKSDKKILKQSSSISDGSDTEMDEEALKKKKMEALLAIASRHSKVFFENDDGDIFSIYRCLLHNKKAIPEIDNEMIAQAIESGIKTTWTVIMVGGGHFAAAVFQDGEALVHKTIHSYTVRAKQGSSQSSRDQRTMGSHPKSAGASLRRYNEAAFTQHIQTILGSWTSHIANSSLILYRAVGPHNRSILFGGKNSLFDKNDVRLRPLPFPTRRATFSEVKRAYDVLSTIEIYGSAADFTDSFPISPRQPIRKRIPKVDLLVEIPEMESLSKNCEDPTVVDASNSSQESGKNSRGNSTQVGTGERQHRSPRAHIDRAKPRKSPRRPLPDIVAKLAQYSSGSELDYTENVAIDFPLITQDCEVDLNDHLLAFQNTVPRHVKIRNIKRQKRKVKKERVEGELPINEILTSTKLQLWDASKSGDNESLGKLWNTLLAEVKRCEKLKDEMDEMHENQTDKPAILRADALTKVLNEPNEEGNTMLHLAAIGGHLKCVWSLLEYGSDPCKKNKKLQTPYAATTDKETRISFRRFMGENPDKYNYNKSQIPGPLTLEMEQEEMEKKKQQKRAKRGREKIKKKEFEVKRKEEESRQRFLSLSDREKRALAAEQRLQQQGGVIVLRCFQCGADITGLVPFEYNSNRFCSMPCLKEHRLHHKFIL